MEADMAKRHHKGGKIAKMVKARAHESEGMHRYEHEEMMHHHSMRHHDGIEDGRRGGRAMYEPSERRMERRDGEMISEDHRAIANMPQHVVYREYSDRRPYLNMNLDDTMAGIDMQQSEDVGIANRHKAKSMY